MHVLFDETNLFLQRKNFCDDENEQIFDTKNSSEDEYDSKQLVGVNQNDKEEELPLSTNVEIQEESLPNVKELQIEKHQHQNIL